MAPHQQRGGVALLVACLLLTLMASAALVTTRNVLREWAIIGTQLGRARAFLAAEAGLSWAEARFGLPLGEPPAPADEGPFLLEGEQGPALQTGFQVHRRCLGRVPRPGAAMPGAAMPGAPMPGAPMPVAAWLGAPLPGAPLPGAPGSPASEPPMDELWECHAHGLCRVGPPGPLALTYHQVCHGWFLVSPPGEGLPPVRRVAWSCNSPCFCDNNVTASW